MQNLRDRVIYFTSNENCPVTSLQGKNWLFFTMQDLLAVLAVFENQCNRFIQIS